ncbi:hypothetical protein OF83DRAFT_1173834 [Amylostereum chailletii]|nr:hypothetical protein OF83DRAFT_1173834 [Amylostereum chailletii]
MGCPSSRPRHQSPNDEDAHRRPSLDAPSYPTRTSKDPAHLESQLAAARDRLQSAGEELHDTRTRLAASETQNRALQAQLAQTTDLLATRTAELEAAQVFLGTHEAFTDVQVAEGVKGLNYEAMQIAVALADALSLAGAGEEGNGGMTRSGGGADEGVGRNGRRRGGGEEGRADEARRWIGSPLADALTSADNARDSLLLEIALQACIVAVVRQVLVRWHFGAEDEDASHVFLDKVSARIFAEEPAAVSGRWRALTRRYAQAALQSHHDVDTAGISLITASALSSVILLARVPLTDPSPLPTPSPAHAPSTPYARAKSLVLDTVGDRLRALVAECVALNRVIGEGITSAAIVPFVVSPGAKYDEKCMRLIPVMSEAPLTAMLLIGLLYQNECLLVRSATGDYIGLTLRNYRSALQVVELRLTSHATFPEDFQADVDEVFRIRGRLRAILPAFIQEHLVRTMDMHMPSDNPLCAFGADLERDDRTAPMFDDVQRLVIFINEELVRVKDAYQAFYLAVDIMRTFPTSFQPEMKEAFDAIDIPVYWIEPGSLDTKEKIRAVLEPMLLSRERIGQLNGFRVVEKERKNKIGEVISSSGDLDAVVSKSMSIFCSYVRVP